ncbi:MAG TPA: hypothetical protein ENG86_10020 [Nitrospirae bacterium]|nr:hypothetical protein [Nitrospirota bacterium]
MTRNGIRLNEWCGRKLAPSPFLLFIDSILKFLEEVSPDVAGATLFILEYERGYGDYTEERKKMFDKKDLQEIIREMKGRNR